MKKVPLIYQDILDRKVRPLSKIVTIVTTLSEVHSLVASRAYVATFAKQTKFACADFVCFLVGEASPNPSYRTFPVRLHPLRWLEQIDHFVININLFVCNPICFSAKRICNGSTQRVRSSTKIVHMEGIGGCFPNKRPEKFAETLFLFGIVYIHMPCLPRRNYSLPVGVKLRNVGRLRIRNNSD